MASTYSMKQKLKKIYSSLLSAFGERGWWPADSTEEVLIGAVLAPNVSWKNVKKAINNLSQQGLLSIKNIHLAKAETIAPLIKSTRYYNQKTQSLKSTCELIFQNWNGKINNAKIEDTNELRNIFLGIKGIGNETADSILLYVLDKPVFVIDAYTKRIFSRIGLMDKNQSYKKFQALFMDNLEKDIDLYKDYHAQIVYLGHYFCKTKPLCGECPLNLDNLCNCEYEIKKG